MSGEPVEVSKLAEAAETSVADVEDALTRLSGQYVQRGMRIQRHGDSVQMVSAPECGAAVERLLGVQAHTRLSPAALETLAIVAYRQPVTRADVEAVRGVNSERALATLQTRGLIAEVGRQETVGRPILFGTTVDFLEYFGLTSLADLPPIETG